jgi:hypothetical protein
MAIDPRIAIGVQAPNLQSSVNLFQNTLNNIQNRKMNAQGMAQNELINPLRVQEAQQVVDSNQMAANNARQNEIIRSVVEFSPTLKPLLESGDNLGALKVLQFRKQDLQSRNVDTTQTDEAIQAITNGDPDQVLQSLNVAEREAVTRGLVGNASNMTAGQRERQSLLRDSQSENETVRNSALVALGERPRAGMSAQERIANDRELTDRVSDSGAKISGAEAKSKTQQTALATREQSAVDIGIESADSFSTITRALGLLKEIDTGGVNAVQLRAKQFFGVEGADEGELSNALGKAVLSQLKTIFGAAFTVQEGERLERIEASFGKSNATNMRLLDRELTKIERKAKRGLIAAQNSGDTFSEGEIQKGLQLLEDYRAGKPEPGASGGQNKVIKFDVNGNIIK